MNQQIPAIRVNGFLDAGKTTYIQDCLKNDFFYKKGTTLILSFEEGEKEYDEALLKQRRTALAVCPPEADIEAFITESVRKHTPDRLYLEMNAMLEIETVLPAWVRVDFSVSLISGDTLALYYNNMRQFFQNMICASQQVIFNRCEKQLLSSYGNVFRVMNSKAVYLWEGPTGYHEKAFGVMVPYELDRERIRLSEEDFTAFYLDALEAPEHYEGKTLVFTAEILKNTDEDTIKAGRRVMTCCIADIQHLGFPCETGGHEFTEGMWIRLTAKGRLRTDRYGRKSLWLIPKQCESVPRPEHAVIGL